MRSQDKVFRLKLTSASYRKQKYQPIACKLLSFTGYLIEIETNDEKKRVVTYIKNGIPYQRRKDLKDRIEKLLTCLVTISCKTNYRFSANKLFLRKLEN